MALIQKFNSFINKILNYKPILKLQKSNIQNLNPLVISFFIICLSIIFFSVSEFVSNRNVENKDNLKKVIKTNEFSDLTNFFISKINSPYEEINYKIKNNDSIEVILKSFFMIM